MAEQKADHPQLTISADTTINWTIGDLTVLWKVDFGISYDSDIDLARSIILDEINKHPDVMHEEDREANVLVTELGDFAVNLRTRFWVADRPTAWVTGAEIRESVKKRFDREGVEIPFPYRTLVYKKVFQAEHRRAQSVYIILINAMIQSKPSILTVYPILEIPSRPIPL